MKWVIFRLLRDIAIIPVTALIVYFAVIVLPIERTGDDEKMVQSAAVTAEAKADLGIGEPMGFLKPWKRFFGDQPLDRNHTPAFDSSFIFGKLGSSVRVGGLALLMACSFALIYAGCSVYLRHRLHGARHAVDLVPTIVFAVPSFVVAVVLVLQTGPCVDAEVATSYEFLAALVAAIAPAAFIGVVLRDALLAELGKLYITAAMARGRSFFGAMVTHALPNAALTVLDALPPLVTCLLTGSFVAERTFNLPYFAKAYVSAVLGKEILLVVVYTTLFAALLVVVAGVADLLKAILNPREQME